VKRLRETLRERKQEEIDRYIDSVSFAERSKSIDIRFRDVQKRPGMGKDTHLYYKSAIEFREAVENLTRVFSTVGIKVAEMGSAFEILAEAMRKADRVVEWDRATGVRVDTKPSVLEAPRKVRL